MSGHWGPADTGAEHPPCALRAQSPLLYLSPSHGTPHPPGLEMLCAKMLTCPKPAHSPARRRGHLAQGRLQAS